MATRKLEVEITGDTKSLEKAFGRAGQEADGLGKKAGTAFKVVGAAATAGGAAVAFGLKKSVDAASNLNESMNAVNVVFGKSSKIVTDFGKDAAAKTGLSMRELNEAVTPIGASLINTGFSADKAAKASTALAQRAADMASVFNTDVGDALGAIQAGLRGEADPLERFGVGLSDAAVKAKAMALGLADSEKALTAQDKAQARLALLMEQTNRVQGDFANTSDGAANAQRILKAEIENASASIGNAFLPLAAKATTAAADIIPKLLDWGGVLVDKLTPAFNTVRDAIGENLPKLQSLADKITGVVKPILVGLHDFIRDNIVPIVGKMRDIYITTAQRIAQVLQEHEPEISRIMGGLKSLVEGLGTVLLWLANTVVIPVLKPLLQDVLPTALGFTITAIDKTVTAITHFKDGIVWIKDNGAAAIETFWNKVDGPLGSIKDAFNAIVSAVEKVIDLIKKIPSPPSWMIPGRGDPFDPNLIFPPASAVGNLVGARGLDGALPIMGPFAAAASAFGLSVSSGLRPGARTRSGNLSDHAVGKALDLVGSAAGMAAFFRSLIGNPAVKQAFYDPLGSIFGGALNSYREGGHSDHVHVATYDQGGWLMPGLTLAQNNTGRPERVIAGGALPVVNVYVSGSVQAEQDLARTIRDELARNGVRNDGTGLP